MTRSRDGTTLKGKKLPPYLQMLQRQMWTSMPMGVRSLLDFGASANGKL